MTISHAIDVPPVVMVTTVASSVPHHNITYTAWSINCTTAECRNDDHRADLVEPALKATLKDLGLDYIDMFLV